MMPTAVAVVSDILEVARDMLAGARSKVKALLDDGKSEQDILDENPLADYESWSWNFDDGSAAVTTEDAAHTYAAAGTYDVTLTVTDGWGKATTVTRQVTVTAPTP